MDIVQRQPVLLAVLALIVGFAIGLFIFGWWLTPIEYSGAGPQHLLERDQRNYLRALADLYAFDNNRERVVEALGRWEDAEVAICQMAADSPDPADAARLNALAAVLNNVGCEVVAAPVQVEPEGRASSLLIICLLSLFLLVLLVAIFMVWSRRTAATRDVGHSYYHDVPEAPPMMDTGEGGEQRAVPIARFQTTYTRGHDSYDESFSIENANGDFLGECGVGISESIGADTPKNVTAFEVWLFDKNDIRTVTKVVMSDHAFYDEAIKAKLAPKGEPVLTRPNETIVLETASLIVNAEIVEMQYGQGTLPPESFFDRLTVELSAWAKEGDYGEPDVQGRIDEMSRY